MKKIVVYSVCMGLIIPIGLNAQFEPVEPIIWTLEIMKQGDGLGVIQGEDIDCGEECYGTIQDGETVTLAATPVAGSVFGGWSGGCSGIMLTCSFTMDEDKIVTAVFNRISNAGNDDGSWFDNEFNNSAAFDFIKKIVKKPKKQWLGYSPLPPFLSIFRKKFDPEKLLGTRWKINQNAQGEPTAQGSLVGRGSYMNIAVGLYTGTVRGVLQGKESWNVLYANRDGAQIAELFWRGGGYQREVIVDAEGNAYQTAFLAEGQTLFAATLEGVLFAVKPGVFPEALRGTVVRVLVPRNGPLIPVDKILDLLQKGISALQNIFFAQSVAATKSLGEQVADYGKIIDQINALQQSFGQINFDDPNTDFNFIQSLIDRFEVAEKALGAAGAAMGHLRMFVRDAGWFRAESPMINPLVDKGVAPSIAALVAQGTPPFDFYAIQGDAKKVVIAGSCRVEKDAKGNQNMACGVRKISPAQAQLILARGDTSYKTLIAADQKLGGIEQAFFGSSNIAAQ